MLNLTYAPSDAEIADKVKADLMASRLKLEHPMLVVIASPEAIQDENVKQAIKEAKSNQHRVAYLKAKTVDLSVDKSTLPPMDIRNGYKIKQLLAYLNNADLGKERLQRSKLLLLMVGGAALLMFFVGIYGINSRQVGFPVERYETEYAVELDQISTFIAPTMEYLQPRTTDDALNYASTVERIPTRVLIFALQTATTLPQSQATLETIGTIAIATEAQMTAQATLEATATPNP
jgi:hypothetical protein